MHPLFHVLGAVSINALSSMVDIRAASVSRYRILGPQSHFAFSFEVRDGDEY